MFGKGHDHVLDEAFKQLFEKYRNRVFGYVLAISHSAYAAEEITQEIFIKLWLCRDLLDEVEQVDAYIFTIARNKTLNYLRKASHDKALLRELQNRAATAVNDVDEHARRTELDRQIHDALTLLSPQRRLVYQLSRNQGLNHDEIAHQLQLSRHTVKNHIVEALRFIRQYIGYHGSALFLILAFLFR